MRELVHNHLVGLVIILDAKVITFILSFFEPDIQASEIPYLLLDCSVVRGMNLHLVLSVQVLHSLGETEGNVIAICFGIELSIRLISQLFRC